MERDSGFPVPLAVFLRRDPVVFPEGPGEGARIGVAAGVAHLVVGQPQVELRDGVLHALLHDVLVGGVPRLAPEQADEIIGVVAEQAAEALDGQILGEVAQDIPLHPGEHLGVPLADKLCDEYDVSAEQARKDVADIIASWQELDVLEA